VCGCLLRTQQCVELLFELVLCQFVFARMSRDPVAGCSGLLGQFLLESLILAQDERWRRA
jgi:hypothetical protein